MPKIKKEDEVEKDKDTEIEEEESDKKISEEVGDDESEITEEIDKAEKKIKKKTGKAVDITEGIKKPDPENKEEVSDFFKALDKKVDELLGYIKPKKKEKEEPEKEKEKPIKKEEKKAVPWYDREI